MLSIHAGTKWPPHLCTLSRAFLQVRRWYRLSIYFVHYFPHCQPFLFSPLPRKSELSFWSGVLVLLARCCVSAPERFAAGRGRRGGARQAQQRQRPRRRHRKRGRRIAQYPTFRPLGNSPKTSPSPSSSLRERGRGSTRRKKKWKMQDDIRFYFPLLLLLLFPVRRS